MSLIRAERRTRTTALVSGDPDVIAAGVISAQVDCRWARRENGYIIPLRVVDRVLVAIERAGHQVEHREALW